MTAQGTAAASPAGLGRAVERFHYGAGCVRGRGVFRIRRGRGWMVRVAGLMIGLPAEGSFVPLRLFIHRQDGAETRERTFGRRRMRATLARTADGEMLERFGMIELRYAASVERNALRLASIGGRVRIGRIAIPLPPSCIPTVRARAKDRAGGGIDVRVIVFSPLGGMLVGYAGHVTEDAE